MKKYKKIGYAMFGTIAIFIMGFLVSTTLPLTVQGASADNLTTYQTAASSSAVIVGPQQNIRIVATSSLRNYLYVANDTGVSAVFCKADQDKEAVLSQGIKLATSTSNFYEFTSSRGNLYVGAVRCTASASTTLILTEYRRP